MQWGAAWHVVGPQWVFTESRNRNLPFPTTFLPWVKTHSNSNNTKMQPRAAQAVGRWGGWEKADFGFHPAATLKGKVGCLRCQSQECEQMWKSNTGFQKYKLFICVLRKPIHRLSRPLSPRSSFLPNGRLAVIFFLVAAWLLAGW